MLKKRKQQLFIESVASGLACLVILIVLLYFAFFMISKPALMNSQESQTETKLPPTQSNKIIVKIPSAPTTPAPNCCYFCKTQRPLANSSEIRIWAFEHPTS